MPGVAPVCDWSEPAVLIGPRVRLEPLRSEHADELYPVLDDQRLHEYVGGEPEDLVSLRARYRRVQTGWSPGGAQRWLNWLVRRCHDEQALGTVQATVDQQLDPMTAELSWVIGTANQGHGHATEAANLMAAWLRQQGVGTLMAHVHPEHGASMAVARAVGLAPTETMVDGEVRWIG